MAGPFASVVAEFQALVSGEPIDLPRAALVIAKLEFPDLNPAASLDRLRLLGDSAARAVAPLKDAPVPDRLRAIAGELFDTQGFAGNHAHYDDFRNSCLNAVLERKLGIPITLALVFMEVAKRAGVELQGVSFPGHFLVRVPYEQTTGWPLVLDPFDAGRPLAEIDCRALLARLVGDEAVFSPRLLEPCTPRQMLARMLNNLKRTYVELRSFQQAYAATDLILTADPTMLFELRDRGLLAYHLDDYPSALRDLEDFVKLHAWTDESGGDERDQIWGHIKNLRRRMAAFN